MNRNLALILMLVGIFVLLAMPFFGMGSVELLVWLLVLAGVIYLAVRLWRGARVST